MKNVLFATTALVALAGFASAESHGGMMSSGVSFGGSFDAGYNDDIDGGLFFDADFDITGEFDLGDGFYGIVTWSASYESGTAGFAFDDQPTIEVGTNGGAITASLKYGDLDDEGASEYFYNDRDGMALDVENHDASEDVRALVQYGNFGFAVGCDNVGNGTCDDGVNYGFGATFGSIELGVGYDDADNTAGEAIGVSADAEFGAFGVGVSYIDVAGDSSIGVEVAYTVSDALSVGAYFASNSAADDAFGVSVDYTAGALTVGAYFDSATVDEFGVDVAYAVSGELTAFAGIYDDGVSADLMYYVGAEYTVNENLSATLSYSEGDEISGPEFKDGISAFLSGSF